jgi:tetratricopeptide (TPR) repeat protein
VRSVQVIIVCAGALFFLSGCGGNEPKLVSNQTTVANTNAQGSNQAQGAAPAKSGASSAPARGGMGEAIDTSSFDARIQKAEEQAKKKPDDKAVRKELAQAYLERGNALTQARQYGAALGDYRRTLRYDPGNEEARYWSDTITGIFNQMNRPVPTEGAEPTPLPKT